MRADPPPRPRLALPILVVALGALTAWAAAVSAPAAPGAARIASAEVLLAIFDAVLVLAVVAPSRALWSDRCAVVMVGMPFHVILASGAGAAPGHAFALALTVASFGTVASISAVRAPHAQRAGAAFAVLALGLPVIAYALGDFLSLELGALLRASPLTGPVLLARTCTDVAPERGLPAVVAAGVWLAVVLTVRPRVAEVSA